MAHKIKRILTATLAILIIASISACTDNATNSSTSKTSSDTTSSVVDVESSVPETSVTDTSVPETTVHTEDTSVETPKPETTVQIVTEVPETSSVPETEAPKPQTTTVTTTTTTVATTKPAPEWTESKTSGTKYINTSCYSRKKAVLGAETVKLYNVNDKVTVTAKTDTGYFKLDNGAFIHGDYLSDSKVTVPATTTTTTTTAKKQETPSQTPSQTEKVNLTVYAAKDDIKIYDENGTVTGGFFYYGSEINVIEILKDKGLYRMRADADNPNRKEYVKISDTINYDPIEKMYHYPFDFDALRQTIIDDAVNNYGLTYGEKIVKDESSWFAPSVVDKNESPAKLKQDLAGMVRTSFKLGGMKKGDYFNIYIEKIPYENAKKFGYGYDPFTGELAYSKEEFEQLDAYAIYFLR